MTDRGRTMAPPRTLLTIGGRHDMIGACIDPKYLIKKNNENLIETFNNSLSSTSKCYAYSQDHQSL